MEIFEGSYGGRLGKDGMDAVDTLYANTRNNPMEDMRPTCPCACFAKNCADVSGGVAVSAKATSTALQQRKHASGIG
jgi:N-methylhydantoinase B/oxoprolinase/acetone carboxylase alpha subunit